MYQYKDLLIKRSTSRINLKSILFLSLLLYLVTLFGHSTITFCSSYSGSKSSITFSKTNRKFYQSSILYKRYFSRGPLNKIADSSLMAEYRNQIRSLLLLAADGEDVNSIRREINNSTNHINKVVSIQSYEMTAP